MDPVIFWSTGAITLAAVLFGLFSPVKFDAVLSNLQKVITTHFNWDFMLSVAIYLWWSVFISPSANTGT